MLASTTQIYVYVVVLALSGSTFALDFECTKDGVFPHPSDYTSFVTCRGSPSLGFISEVFQCPDKLPFDSDQSECVSYGTKEHRASDPECQEQYVSCKDCKTLVTCQYTNNSYINPTPIDCPQYCDASINSCVNELPSGCSLPGFVCTGEGYFPDPTDCEIYHICYNVTTNGYESHVCPSVPEEHVYSSSKFACVIKTSEEDCVTTTCSDGFVGTMEYPKDTNYYILCLPEGDQLIYRCFGNLEYVPSIHTCQFVCHEEGNFPNTDDCTKYHTCISQGGGQFIHVEQQCPVNWAFDVNTGTCQPKASVPSCK